MKAQRLRFRYRLTTAACELRQREIVSAWEAAVKAAGLDLSYSEGKRPGPQISLAAPLPQGVTSDWEMADVYLATRVEPAEALARVASHFPTGLEPTSVTEIGIGAPSLQSILRWAEYEVDVPGGELSNAHVREAIEQFLSQTSVMVEHKRERKTRDYNLRALVLDIRLETAGEGVYHLRMRLRAEQENTARADETAIALGLPSPVRVHRTKLALDDTSAAIQAYRRAREPELRW